MLEPGLRRMYRGGRREWRAMQKGASVEGLHEWRKRVKEFWYDHELLKPLWKPVMKAVGDEAHDLSDLLGDDHDLAVLLDWARNHADAPPELVEAVEKRRRDLQEQASSWARVSTPTGRRSSSGGWSGCTRLRASGGRSARLAAWPGLVAFVDERLRAARRWAAVGP